LNLGAEQGFTLVFDDNFKAVVFLHGLL